jgi:DNA-directed RNA polymerase specialized sigma24 family protein
MIVAEAVAMRDTERRLEKSARNGCIDAFEELIAPHQGRIYNLMLRTCEDEFEASRLAQEVFVKVFEELSRNHEGRGLSACIYCTAAEISRNVARKSVKIS